MQIKSLLIAALLFAAGTTMAQQPFYNQQRNFLKANSVWAFQENAGWNFNTGSPVVTDMSVWEGSAAVSDPETGDLLFYSNGVHIWNANHDIMDNGDWLFGAGRYTINGLDTTIFASVTQGVTIVPVINEPGKYYVFSLGVSFRGSQSTGTLFYNVVDMSLDGGLGAVVSGKKNIPLSTEYLSESMIAIPGDHCDIWLMVHPSREDEFYAYHITAAGIDTTPVISPTIGFSGNFLIGYGISAMGVSPDRSKIAMGESFSGIVMADFDPQTGVVSNVIPILSRPSSNASTGFCFSPDGSVFYTREGAEVCQYDISVINPTAIQNSRLVIGNGSNGNSGLYRLRLYNDTIYVGEGTGSTVNQLDFMSRINQPNNLGMSCDFEDSAIIFSPGGSKFGRLGSEVVFPIAHDTSFNIALDTQICETTTYTLEAPSGFDAYLWGDSSTQATREITVGGIYYVVSKDCDSSRVDTFKVSGLDMQQPIINIEVHNLGTTASYTSYQWMLDGQLIQGANDSTYTVQTNGDYQVIVTSESGCVDTSDVYPVNNIDESGIASRATLARQIRIYPNPAHEDIQIDAPIAINIKLYSIDGKTLKPAITSNRLSLQGLTEGIYFLRIYDQQGRFLKIEKVIKAL